MKKFFIPEETGEALAFFLAQIPILSVVLVDDEHFEGAVRRPVNFGALEHVFEMEVRFGEGVAAKYEVVGLAEGLPVAIELDGPAGSDRRLLALGLAVEALFDRLTPPARA